MKKQSHFHKNIMDAEINFAIAEAHKITDAIWDDKRPNYDPGGVIFSVFINCIHYLTLLGWSEQELVNEIFEHSEDPDDLNN